MGTILKFYDLGANIGDCSAQFIKIAHLLGMEYRVYAFEPHPDNVSTLKFRFGHDLDVIIVPAAVGLKDGKQKLYLSEHNDGHSIHKSKNNVDPSRFINIGVIKLSTWMKASSGARLSGLSIIKANIEGSEWELTQDMRDNDLFKEFDIYTGTCSWTRDMRKCRRIRGKIPIAEAILEENEINVIPMKMLRDEIARRVSV